jgi:hypothetical protein
MNPVAPVLSQKTAHFFMHPSDVDPWEINDGANVTSALKFGAHFDLLGLTQTDDLLLSGAVDVTDCLDPNLSISALYYRTKNGDVHKLNLTGMPLVTMVPIVEGDYRRVELNLTLMVSNLGAPQSFIGKLYHKLLARLGYEKIVPVKIFGAADLQLGTVQVDYSCAGVDITPLGYTLEAYRFNHNRRPAEGKCPFMH